MCIEVPAGESVELLFTCNNDQMKVVTFELEASGLGAWALEKTEHPVAPFDTSNLSFTITPKQTAELGDYPFTVRLLCGGDLVEPVGERALTLRVTEGAPVPVEEPPPPVVAPPSEPIHVAAIAPPAEKPKTTVKKTITVAPVESGEAPIGEEPPPPIVEDPQPEPDPEPEPEPEPIPEPEPEPEPPAPAPIPEPEPIFAPEPPKEEVMEPEPEPAPTPTFFEPEPEIVYVEEPKPEPKPDPVPVSRPEPKVVKVVDFDQPAARGFGLDEPEEETPLQIQADATIANPPEGTSIYARPGERVLVRFSIKNEQSGVRTYVIQEDRALPIEWIALVQDQVNITPGGSGDVSVMLTPPLNAEPATYPFTVAYGILGQPLTPVYLQLCVQAAPAVKLKVKADSARVWVPFARALDYEFTVESQGNADTAYRISVKDPLAERDDQGRPKGPDDLYETPTWRYLFDREIDTLASPSANRPPTPEQHKMKLRRRGIWWFGWVEKHKMTVAARPVTDGANGGKGENVVELKGMRWRLFPLPGFITVPLAISLFILLASGATGLHISNGRVGEDGICYVVGQSTDETSLPVSLKWEAPIYAFLKGTKTENDQAKPLSIAHSSAKDVESIQGYGQAQKVTYQIGSMFTPGGQQAVARFVPLRTTNKLALIDDHGAPLSGTPIPDDTVGEDKVPITGREITIIVPKDGLYHINFRNLTGVKGVNAQTIVLWTIQRPEGFDISDFITQQPNNDQVIPSGQVTAKISVSKAASISDEGSVWELLTTDQTFQHLKIHLKVGN